MNLIVDVAKKLNIDRFNRIFSPVVKSADSAENEDTIRSLIDDVKTRGDVALVEYTAKFDGVRISPSEMEFSQSEIQAAFDRVDENIVKALKKAADNISIFHEQHLPTAWTKELREGARLGQMVSAIEKVGVYVPGARAFYPSSVLMNIVPARVAGCTDIVMVSPPTYEGSIHPGFLAAASIAGATRIFRVGGAQAIAALAYGTETIPKVDKVGE